MNWLHRYCSSIVKKDHVIWFFFRIYRCVVCLIYLWSISSSDRFHIWLLSSLTSFSNIMIWFIFQNSNHLCILYHICWVVRHCYSNDEYIDGILKGRRFLVSAKGCCIFQNEKKYLSWIYIYFSFRDDLTNASSFLPIPWKEYVYWFIQITRSLIF
jgi:hypothetical protein